MGLFLFLLLGHLGRASLLLFLTVLGQALLIVLLQLLAEDHPVADLGFEVALPLQQSRSDQPLDLRRLLLLADLAADDKLAHVVLLLEVEELADVRGALRAQAPGLDVVREAGDLLVALLDDGEREDREVAPHDAAAHGLALAAALAPLAEAGHALLEEQPHAVVDQNPLLHGKPLLVIATSDADHVAFPLVPEGVSCHLCCHSLVEKWHQLLIVIDLDQLLAAGRGVRNVQLHGFAPLLASSDSPSGFEPPWAKMA
mmetsp:Transcript_59747/g.185180  ORF Transcript_59747/g.185180 Transcript_59747/m.185180 type:complete len:257 (+) Transcript_59747:75-845(+)